MLQELTMIAKAYCKKYGYEFMFANETKFGYMTKDEQFWTIHYTDLANML